MRSSALLLMSLAGTPLQAATLGDVAAALANREANTYNHWDALLAVPGANWRDATVWEAPSSFARESRVMLNGLGEAIVLVVGVRQMMFDAEVSTAARLERKDLTRKLKAQFPADTKIELVRRDRGSEISSGGSRIYRVTLRGMQPQYVRVEFADGRGSHRNGTSFSLAREKKTQWTCQEARQ
jgi:hypothetical protein